VTTENDDTEGKQECNPCFLFTAVIERKNPSELVLCNVATDPIKAKCKCTWVIRYKLWDFSVSTEKFKLILPTIKVRWQISC
jgi:hypothetical protein